MYLQEFPSEFKQALPILQQIEAHGYEAYFVGGSVRDFLLGKAIADVDIATSAFPAEIKQIFPKTIDTGIKHGTVTVLVDGIGYEVTTFRTESGYQDFRRPDHVTFVRSLQQDLQRRDFTINALAVRADGLIIDDYHGLNDLAAQEIRAVGIADERFHEDALRMMRAVRFASQLGFTITADTYTSLLHNAPLLQKIAVERIHTEFVKMMLSKDWRIGWQLFVDSGLIKQTPFFKANELKFPRFTTSKSTLKLLDEPAIWILLAEGLNLTPTQLKQLLLGWKSANDVIAESLRTLTFSRQLQATTALTAKQLYQADTQIIERVATIWPLLQWSADFDQIALDYRRLPIKNRHELQLNGVDLIQKVKLNPGPQIGDWLDRAETAVVERRIENQNATLIRWVQQQTR